MVAAYFRRQAAALLKVAELYLKRNGTTATDDEIKRAEGTPGQVWVQESDAPNFTKWRYQLGGTWT